MQKAKGSSVKDVLKKDHLFYSLPVRSCPHLVNPLPPLCERPHLAPYTALYIGLIIGAFYPYSMWTDMWVI